MFLFILIAFLFTWSCVPLNMDFFVHMPDDQEVYLQKEIVPAFEAENRVKIQINNYKMYDSINRILHNDTVKPGLVKIPFCKSVGMMNKGVLLPLDSIVTKDELAALKNEYLLMPLGELDGKQFLIPAKFETTIMVYCKSKVSEAVSAWREFKDQIDTELKKYNGYGIPETYYLEDDPELWDYYDLFVIGWIWANKSYSGEKKARIAYGTKTFSGTAPGIIDRVYQLNGNTNEVISMKGESVIDAFYWESVYVSAGILDCDMWNKKKGKSDIWQGFARGEIFLSFMTQSECFFLHGTGRDNLDGYLENPDDMGVATMPRGCSMRLDTIKAIPESTGKKTVTTGGWWWGIPKKSPDPAASFKFISFITSTFAQIRECTRFGMIPVKKDILEDIQMLSGGMWISHIYNVSLKQLIHNGDTFIGVNPVFEKISVLYLDAWNDIVVNRNWSYNKTVPSRKYISELISRKYAKIASEIVSENDF